MCCRAVGHQHLTIASCGLVSRGCHPLRQEKPSLLTRPKCQGSCAQGERSGFSEASRGLLVIRQHSQGSKPDRPLYIPAVGLFGLPQLKVPSHPLALTPIISLLLAKDQKLSDQLLGILAGPHPVTVPGPPSSASVLGSSGKCSPLLQHSDGAVGKSRAALHCYQRVTPFTWATKVLSRPRPHSKAPSSQKSPSIPDLIVEIITCAEETKRSCYLLPELNSFSPILFFGLHQ